VSTYAASRLRSTTYGEFWSLLKGTSAADAKVWLWTRSHFVRRTVYVQYSMYVYEDATCRSNASVPVWIQSTVRESVRSFLENIKLKFSFPGRGSQFFHSKARSTNDTMATVGCTVEYRCSHKRGREYKFTCLTRQSKQTLRTKKCGITKHGNGQRPLHVKTIS
jgi:hypothetical protein